MSSQNNNFALSGTGSITEIDIKLITHANSIDIVMEIAKKYELSLECIGDDEAAVCWRLRCENQQANVYNFTNDLGLNGVQCSISLW